MWMCRYRGNKIINTFLISTPFFPFVRRYIFPGVWEECLIWDLCIDTDVDVVKEPEVVDVVHIAEIAEIVNVDDDSDGNYIISCIILVLCTIILCMHNTPGLTTTGPIMINRMTSWPLFIFRIPYIVYVYIIWGRSHTKRPSLTPLNFLFTTTHRPLLFIHSFAFLIVYCLIWNVLRKDHLPNKTLNICSRVSRPRKLPWIAIEEKERHK